MNCNTEQQMIGLLLCQAAYLKVKEIYGQEFYESVACVLARLIDQEIQQAITAISIQEFYDTLSTPFNHWQTVGIKK